MKKEKLFKLTEKIRIIFFVFMLLYGFLAIKFKIFPAIIFPYLVIVHATLLLLSALYFKKTIGVIVYVGKEGYLSWGIINFLLYFMIALALLFRYYHSHYSIYVLIFGIILILLVPTIIKVIKYSYKNLYND